MQSDMLKFPLQLAIILVFMSVSVVMSCQVQRTLSVLLLHVEEKFVQQAISVCHNQFK